MTNISLVLKDLISIKQIQESYYKDEFWIFIIHLKVTEKKLLDRYKY